MTENDTPKHGKQPNQKLKPYIVLQYLLRESDENNVRNADELVAYLDELGIYAERRSVYRDIEAINKMNWLLENEGATIQDAEAALAADEYDEEKLVLYDKSKKGFYVRQRHYDLHDIRLLAECVYSAKFLAEKEADRLADVVCEFVSREQAKAIRHDAFLTDRVKTDNKSVINNISSINAAMSNKLDGEKHDPEKISFKYLQYSINHMSRQAERRKGARYIVSPYKLLISDGNYYLLAFDDASKKIKTYRVDRIKDVRFEGEPRDGAAAFAAINLKDYTKRAFSMFSGKTERVQMRFINLLLDTVVDRFGTAGIIYEKVDERHFSVSVSVDVSDQFFGWLLGLGRRVKLLSPQPVVDQFKAYLEKIIQMY